MKRESIGKAMRSCYPEFVVSKRKPLGAGMVETEDPAAGDLDDDPVVEEVEAFLAQHEAQELVGDDDEEAYEEKEVAEALAVSWREKRKEITKMQRSRKFGAANDLKRSYRVEIEELKRKTRCHKCGQVGHWSRECRSQSGKGKGRTATPASAKGSDSGAALVQTFEEHFVATVEHTSVLSDVWKRLRSSRSQPVDAAPSCCASAKATPEILLVSSPGYGVIDSGCGRTIIGQNTLDEFKQLWKARGIPTPEPMHEINHFKYGNGERETSECAMKLPVVIAGFSGIIKAAVVKGNAPLLISRNALQTLKAVVDFGQNKMNLFENKATVPVFTNEAGQYVISVLGDSSTESSNRFQEVMMNEVSAEKTITAECLPVNCIRKFEAQACQSTEKSPSEIDGKPFLVAEVFCPPRFSPLIHGVGGACKSYDLKTGYDFSKASIRDSVAEELRINPPDLLILCPPCTDEGGWFNLNACTMEPSEYLRRVKQSRMFIRFCCRLYEQQVAAGGQALLEHPKESKLWTYPEVQRLLDRHFLLSCHMCRYGLRVPGDDRYIRKATNLLVSHENMKGLERKCPGKQHPKHVCHQPIAGSCSQVGRISTFAGKYTPRFVEAVMEVVPRYRDLKAKLLVPVPEWPAHAVEEVLAAKPDLSEAKTDAELLKVLDKVHRNLGHPPNTDLVRILKHAGASERAISLAHKLECAFCRAQIKPHVPLPAKTSRPSVFNQVIGIDVKFLSGWQPNQQIKALNIVDQASCYQLMIPFYEKETSEVLKRLILTLGETVWTSTRSNP
eukprot:s111_g4.t1